VNLDFDDDVDVDDGDDNRHLQRRDDVHDHIYHIFDNHHRIFEIHCHRYFLHFHCHHHLLYQCHHDHHENDEVFDTMMMEMILVCRIPVCQMMTGAIPENGFGTI
jgi:hypothetical protein